MKPSILLVDEQLRSAELITTYLRISGYEINHTIYPNEAIRIVNRTRYSMIICDLIMQEMNAFELYREIKSLDDEIKFLFLLNIQFGNDVLRLLGTLSRQDVIKKDPLSISEVLYKVHSAFID